MLSPICARTAPSLSPPCNRALTKSPSFWTDRPAGVTYNEFLHPAQKIWGREVTIEGSSEVQLTITMGSALGQLAGVAQLNGKPAAGVMVLLVPESGPNLEDDSRMGQTDSDGTFT